MSGVAVLGHRGLVGSAVVRRLGGVCVTANGVDLRDREDVLAWWEQACPEQVYMAAAVVGGIEENTSEPVKFIRDNLEIAVNVMTAANLFGCDRLLFLGSSCIYPRDARQPIRESSLLSGHLEETNRAYAVAKIAGLEMVRAYRKQYGRKWISVMPCNVYGNDDHSSHVIPMLMRRFYAATLAGLGQVMVWGTGTPRREFIHADDLASACVHLMGQYNDTPPINVGTGVDWSIKELAEMIAKTVGYEGRIVFDASRPDGTPRKVLDVSRIRELGWRPQIELPDGLARVYRRLLESQS